MKRTPTEWTACRGSSTFLSVGFLPKPAQGHVESAVFGAMRAISQSFGEVRAAGSSRPLPLQTAPPDHHLAPGEIDRDISRRQKSMVPQDRAARYRPQQMAPRLDWGVTSPLFAVRAERDCGSPAPTPRRPPAWRDRGRRRRRNPWSLSVRPERAVSMMTPRVCSSDRSRARSYPFVSGRFTSRMATSKALFRKAL